MHEILHIIEHGFLDSLKVLPFLFLAFLIMEFCEKHSEGKLTKALEKKNLLSPIIGSALGLVPQCGFSVTGAGLFCGGLISLGTLIAIFLSTSDEALIILLTNGRYKDLIALLVTKFLIAAVWGIIIDLLLRKRQTQKDVHDLCVGCGCETSSGVLLPALRHTVKIFVFILICNILLEGAVEIIGEQAFNKFMLSGSFLQPVICAVIGLIPNCASSVMLTQLYMANTLSFGALVSGLLVNSGVAVILLFKQNRPHKENIFILLINFIIASFSGIIISLFI